jgi:hypothetical protein
MAGGASTENSEPLFVLEPLPKLSETIDSFVSANPLLLLVAIGAVIYFLVKFNDPMMKMWTTTSLFLGLNYYVTESLFYSMIFTSVHVLAFSLVWAAIRWDEVKYALGMDKAKILSWLSFVVCTWILVVLGTAIGMPIGPGLVICISITGYLWWTYYSLEPVRA